MINITSPPTSYYRLGYRAEIEGLRALAILLVVGNHVGIPWLNGGFIGVDIFFVLSGYLITGLLVKEIRKTGKLDLIEFYSRRLKRLLPALLLMIVCISFAATILLPPFDQIEQAAAARSSSIWISNLTFAFANLDYFSSGAETNLFLHTWSLGVEEQFYLTWPLAILLFSGAFRWQGDKADFKRLRRGLYAAIAVCLALSIFLSYTQQPWAFYLMPSRAWQFALGAIISLGMQHNNPVLDNNEYRVLINKHQILHRLTGWLGFGIIIIALSLLNSKATYPSFWALMPSIGTALILTASSSNQSLGFNQAISILPMRWLGRVSYSWYLWHWPALVLGAAIFHHTGPVTTSLIAAISLLLASISYVLVENPLRRNTFFKPRAISVLFVSVTLMCCAVAGASIWLKKAEVWMHSPKMQRYLDIRSDIPVIYGMGCDNWFHSANVQICAFGDSNAQHTTVILGDSIIGQWFPTIMSVFDSPDWRVLVLTKSSCPIVDEPWFYERIGGEYKVCETWRHNVLQTMKAMKPDLIITGGSSNYDFNQSQWTSGTKRILDTLSPSSQNVVILRGTHELGFDGPTCLAQNKWIPDFLPFDNDCTTKVNSQRNSQIYTWLQEAASGFDNVSTLDMNTEVCPMGICYAEKDGVIAFRDNMHLTAQFALSLSDALAEKLKHISPEIIVPNMKAQ